MAVRQHGVQKTHVNEMKQDGVATQKELEDAIALHLSTYGHTLTSSPNGVIPLSPYYYDAIRDKYLSLDVTTVTYFLSGTTRKNMYMQNIPGIPSNIVPERIMSDYTIVGIEAYTTNSIPNNTNIMTLTNTVDSSTILTISNNTGSSSTEFYNDSVNILLEPGIKLANYILNYGLDNPVLKVYLRKTYYPTV